MEYTYPPFRVFKTQCAKYNFSKWRIKIPPRIMTSCPLPKRHWDWYTPLKVWTRVRRCGLTGRTLTSRSRTHWTTMRACTTTTDHTSLTCRFSRGGGEGCHGLCGETPEAKAKVQVSLATATSRGSFWRTVLARWPERRPIRHSPILWVVGWMWERDAEDVFGPTRPQHDKSRGEAARCEGAGEFDFVRATPAEFWKNDIESPRYVHNGWFAYKKPYFTMYASGFLAQYIVVRGKKCTCSCARKSPSVKATHTLSLTRSPTRKTDFLKDLWESPHTGSCGVVRDVIQCMWHHTSACTSAVLGVKPLSFVKISIGSRFLYSRTHLVVVLLLRRSCRCCLRRGQR